MLKTIIGAVLFLFLAQHSIGLLPALFHKWGQLNNWGDIGNGKYIWVLAHNDEAKAANAIKPFHLLRPIPKAIKKPSFYAYQFLNGLGNTDLINNDASSWAYKDKSGNLQLLMWYYKLLSPDSLYNQEFYGKLIPSVPVGSVKFVVKNMLDGKYQFQVYRIGYHQNDVYSAYLELGAPYNISLRQEKQLKTLANGNPVSQKDILTKGGTFTASFELRQNDIYFLKLNRL